MLIENQHPTGYHHLTSSKWHLWERGSARPACGKACPLPEDTKGLGETDCFVGKFGIYPDPAVYQHLPILPHRKTEDIWSDFHKSSTHLYVRSKSKWLTQGNGWLSGHERLVKGAWANKTTPKTAAGTTASIGWVITFPAESSHHYSSSHVWHLPNIYLHLLAQILYVYIYIVAYAVRIYIYIPVACGPLSQLYTVYHLPTPDFHSALIWLRGKPQETIGIPRQYGGFRPMFQCSPKATPERWKSNWPISIVSIATSKKIEMSRKVNIPLKIVIVIEMSVIYFFGGLLLPSNNST